MKAELTCDEIRVELSARLDQEVEASTAALLEEHLATCGACRAHEESLRAVKRAVALQAAPQMRDLAPAVTSRLAREMAVDRAQRRSLLRTALAAAVVTGLVLSGALVPWRDRSPDIAVASEISREVRAAATRLTSYHARFDVVERGWHAQVPVRRFSAEIWFEAPERLRMEIRDRTQYPGTDWPTNDATLIADAQRWWLRETASCPPPALPGCEVGHTAEVRSLAHRQPFDGSTALPTDLILPLETLSDAETLTVVGRSTIQGRDAHHVTLQYWQAAPLLNSLQVSGTWRTFGPTADVDLWLDAETWFPLRFTVRGRRGSLSATSTFLDRSVDAPASVFEPPAEPPPLDGGFRPTGKEGITPSYVGGLDPYRRGITLEGQRIESFADGLTWLRVLTDRDTKPTLATFASEVVRLSNGSVAYVEPSADPLRRVVELIGQRRRVRLEANLPRGELLQIAASVPVTGRAIDRLRTADGMTIERVGAQAIDDVDYALEPSYLPAGFEFSSAFTSTSREGSEQLTIYYRRPKSGSGTNEIRVVQAPRFETLPPTSEDLTTVAADGLRARWSPARSELEWLDGTTYRAVSVPAFDLATAVEIALSLDP